MKTLFYIIILALLSTCEKESPIELNNQAIELFSHGKSSEAKLLLDKAIEIDPNYILAYRNKLMVLKDLGLNDELIETNRSLIKVEPNNPSNLILMGVLLELNHDSSGAMSYYRSADSLCDIILDTLTPSADPQYSVATTKAQNLKLLGREKEANELLENIKSKVSEIYMKEMLDEFIARDRAVFMEFMK